jgi:hypothetical protein
MRAAAPASVYVEMAEGVAFGPSAWIFGQDDLIQLNKLNSDKLS